MKICKCCGNEKKKDHVCEIYDFNPVDFKGFQETMAKRAKAFVEQRELRILMQEFNLPAEDAVRFRPIANSIADKCKEHFENQPIYLVWLHNQYEADELIAVTNDPDSFLNHDEDYYYTMAQKQSYDEYEAQEREGK